MIWITEKCFSRKGWKQAENLDTRRSVYTRALGLGSRTEFRHVRKCATVSQPVTLGTGEGGFRDFRGGCIVSTRRCIDAWANGKKRGVPRRVGVVSRDTGLPTATMSMDNGLTLPLGLLHGFSYTYKNFDTGGNM